MGVRSKHTADQEVCPIRVALCDDDALVLSVLKETLNKSSRLQIVFAATHPEAAIAYSGKVDVWLIDIKMPGIGGLEAARHIISASERVKVILLTSGAEVSTEEIAASGVSGFLFKDARLPRLVVAIEAAAAGFHVSSSPVTTSYSNQLRMIPDAVAFTVEARDEFLVNLLLEGKGYAEISSEMSLSLSGLKKRVANLMRAAGVRSRPALMSALHSRVDHGCAAPKK